MYKVRCKLISFEGDEKTFPCHFNYKIGDEFYYDGVYFTGRICPGLFASMMPIIHGVCLSGNRFSENIMYLYRGLDTRDPSMAKYDGEGFKPVANPDPSLINKLNSVLPHGNKSGKAGGGHFLCADHRILAHFAVTPVDISDSEYAQPFYRREISLLEKIEKEPGIKVADILNRFTKFEREEIGPPLSPQLFDIMMFALEDMKYIETRDGKAYPLGKEPPTRPRIG
jgi:uncharacterized repeat protein (TIGR04076 family)